MSTTPQQPDSPAASTFMEQFGSYAATCASYLRLPLLGSASIAALAGGLLYFKQKELIYPRTMLNSRTEVPKPVQFGISDCEELYIKTPDNETLHAFYIRAANRRHHKNTTILMFHGNAGNIGYRLPIAKMFSELGYSVLMLEYRGYGFSTGSPDEHGIMIDAQTGLDYLRERPETADNNIVIYGQSLGGAVSIQLVAKNQHDGAITGLILENTFTSMRKLIPSIIPPARYIAGLCHQTWHSETFIPTITEVPVLFLSGLKDEIVPPPHMRRLYDICQSPTKIWHPLPGGDHNNSVAAPGYFDAIASFVKNLPTRKLEKGY